MLGIRLGGDSIWSTAIFFFCCGIILGSNQQCVLFYPQSALQHHPPQALIGRPNTVPLPLPKASAFKPETLEAIPDESTLPFASKAALPFLSNGSFTRDQFTGSTPMTSKQPEIRDRFAALRVMTLAEKGRFANRPTHFFWQGTHPGYFHATPDAPRQGEVELGAHHDPLIYYTLRALLFDSCSRALLQNTLRESVLDVGASVGHFALYMAAMGCSVTAVEANPKFTFFLNMSAIFNGFDDSQLKVWLRLSGDTAANKQVFVKGLEFHTTKTMGATPLMVYEDSLAHITSGRVMGNCSVMKIDIEGMELSTLEAMQRDEVWCDSYVVEWSPMKWETYGWSTGMERGTKVMRTFVLNGYAIGLSTNTQLDFSLVAGGRAKAWGRMPSYFLASTPTVPHTNIDATFGGKCATRCDMLLTRNPRAIAMLNAPENEKLRIY